MSYRRRNSVRNKVIGKKWIYLERHTFHRQNVVHLKRQERPWEKHSTECGPSQKLRGLEIWGGQLFKFIYLFFNLFYFWLRQVFVAARGLSLAAASGGYSSLQCASFSLWWLLLLRSTGSRHAGFSSCGTRAQQLWLVGSRVQAQQLWLMCLVALWHVGSSQTRDQTRLPCTGRWILNYCTTREVPGVVSF